ncbi:MAG: glycosyltransferase, partial [Solirubrobacteraceae bacterium]
LPSLREGYGLIVVEAASRGVPSVVVHAPDNAAVDLIEEGQNGVLAASASADDLASAILRVHGGGAALRAATAEWFARNADRLSLEGSLSAVVRAYAGSSPSGSDGSRSGSDGPSPVPDGSASVSDRS